jgi:hypothetical protein
MRLLTPPNKGLNERLFQSRTTETTRNSVKPIKMKMKLSNYLMLLLKAGRDFPGGPGGWISCRPCKETTDFKEQGWKI